MSKLTKQVIAGIFLHLWKLTGYRVQKITQFADSDNLKNIAIFSTTALGDFLINTPAIRAIKMRWPEAKIILVMNQRNKLLAEDSEIFNEVLYWNGKANGVVSLVKILRKHCIDATFLLHSRSPYDIVTASMARSPIILKDVYYNDYLGRDRFYLDNFLSAHYDNRIKGNLHLIRQKTELLESVGIKTPSLEMFIPIPFTVEKTQQCIIGIHAGASSQERCWPAQNFTQLIQHIMAKYPAIEIRLIGGPGEQDLNKKIIDGLEGDFHQVTNLAGKTNLKQLVENVASFACLVVGDTGPYHVAIATRTPVIGLLATQMHVDGVNPLQDQEKHFIIKAKDEEKGIVTIPINDVFVAIECCIATMPSFNKMMGN
ncbi:glycosyltransferase family 9 protein [Buttiauxella warmboldiae]|uniref:Glycosyltransferase family 9 protein n=1 Tax=Buttiauxella warmboldiae TaxID=82993 RepID=A0A3N5DRP6_9ENTR|nr:glycosyltransferase family 9 protein [Buttiauxella warmboldiae]RPH31078.1 glycosyltransferase family 9 protein [Buttiauxella warmboldiae]